MRMVEYRYFLVVTWIVFVGAMPFRAHGSSPDDPLLDEGLSRMASEIGKFLDEEKRPRVVIVGDFSGIPSLKASGGVELSRQLSAKLANVKIEVSDDAETQIMGSFKTVNTKQHDSDDFESLALEITAQILDSNGTVLTEMPIKIFGSTPLRIAGRDVHLPPAADERKRQGQIKEQLKNPTTVHERNRIRSSSDSPFAIELLVVKGNKMDSLPPSLDSKKRSFVELNQGDEYVVRLHNGSNFEAAISLLIDGVNMFVDAKDESPNSRIVVAPGKSADIPGWFITKTQTKAFQISGYDQSVAGRLGQNNQIGTVTAIFHACWEPGKSPPDDEPGGTPRGGKATKQGRDLHKDYNAVARDIGAIRDIINVRYDR